MRAAILHEPGDLLIEDVDEQVVVPAAVVARNTHALPDALDLAAAAPLEPLACVAHGIAESGIALGDTVVVHGAVLFGGPPSGTTFSVDTVAMHHGEHTLKGVFPHTPQYVATAVDLLVSGAVDGTSLITDTRPLDALVDSLEDMAEGRGSKHALVP